YALSLHDALPIYTGALATDDRVFDGVARQIGLSRAASVEQGFEVAATFATQPLPRGNRVVVVTTVGGWGVAAADAIGRTDLELVPLPADLQTAIDAELPPRWSRNNPVDMAGGETRDTVPRILEMVASHPDVDAVVFLGMGIQSNQARLMREGPLWPDHGLERIGAFPERQDARYAGGGAAASDRPGTRRPASAAPRPAAGRAGAPRPRRGSDPGRGRPTGPGAAPAGAEGGGCCRPSWRPAPAAPAPARSPSTPPRPPTRPGSTGWWPRRSSPPAAPRRSAPPRWPTAGWRATCWRGWPTRPRTPAWSSRPTAARCWPTTPTSR